MFAVCLPVHAHIHVNFRRSYSDPMVDDSRNPAKHVTRPPDPGARDCARQGRRNVLQQHGTVYVDVVWCCDKVGV